MSAKCASAHRWKLGSSQCDGAQKASGETANLGAEADRRALPMKR